MFRLLMLSQKVEDADESVEQMQDSSNMVESNEVPEILLFLKLIIVVMSQAKKNLLAPPLIKLNLMKMQAWQKRIVHQKTY